MDLDRIEFDNDAATVGYRDVVALVAEVRRLRSMLADCYRATGADPDGNEDWRLAEHAVAEVVSALEFADEELNEVTRELFERDAEADRLRAGIRDHREAVCAELTCCDDCRSAGKEPSHASANDADLWALLDDQEDDRDPDDGMTDDEAADRFMAALEADCGQDDREDTDG